MIDLAICSRMEVQKGESWRYLGKYFSNVRHGPFGRLGRRGTNCPPLLPVYNVQNGPLDRCGWSRGTAQTVRGRGCPFRPPPAQIPASGIPAQGSSYRYLARKRIDGYGCRTTGVGSQSIAPLLNASHFIRPLWLLWHSTLLHILARAYQKDPSRFRLPGTAK
jgi:hypothetical protein